jgi:hypothetical protein
VNNWHQAAMDAAEDLIDNGEPFSADDLIELVGLPDADHEANGRNSAMGAVFNQLHHQGRIKPVGVTKSRQKHRKGGLIRVWQAA